MTEFTEEFVRRAKAEIEQQIAALETTAPQWLQAGRLNLQGGLRLLGTLGVISSDEKIAYLKRVGQFRASAVVPGAGEDLEGPGAMLSLASELSAEAKGRLETKMSNIGPGEFSEDDDWAWDVFKGVEAVISELCDLCVLTSIEADEYSRRAQEAWDSREAVSVEAEVSVSVSSREQSLSEEEQARRAKMTARLKECRRTAGLTMAEVAQRVADLSGEAVPAYRYSNWEMGTRTPPVGILSALAKLFDKPLEYISGTDQGA